jgi:hypothetical protein
VLLRWYDLGVPDDFDPAVYGGLQADDEVDPARAMAAAMSDNEPLPAMGLIPVVVGLISALAVAIVWWALE